MTAETAAPTGPAGLPDRSDYGPVQLADWLGLKRWQIEAAETAGLIPTPDKAGQRWSASAAQQIAGRLADIVREIGTEPPIGGHRAAKLLAERTGLDVERSDIETLADRGLLAIVDHYKDWPLYDVRHLAALDERQVAAAVAERLLGPDQAAAHLAIRRTDWEYAVEAGWIAARKVIEVEVGRYSSVSVPLYRTADVEALLQVPGVDWEEVRATPPGKPSPLREYARRPPTRAQVIRSWVAALGHRYEIEVWAWYHGGAQRWEIDWEVRADGTPTLEQVRADLVAHRPAARYADVITLSCQAGAAIRWARAMLEPGAAVVLDTETTDLDGVVIEVAVIDAATGETLLDTLVDPAGEPIAPGAYAVHGISTADLAGAPSWSQVLPALLRVTAGRTVLAYNADFDQARVMATCARHDLDPEHLAAADRWGCVMNRRSDWARTGRWLPLGGGHRALGDALAAREVLLAMTAP